MTTDRELFSIGEVSTRTGISVDTLRFYENQGLFSPPKRTSGGRRLFHEEDIAWIGICQRLRASGMPLPEIARYAELVRAGAGNEAQRLELLQRHETAVQSQMAELQDALHLITSKVRAYADALASGTAHGLFVRDHDDDVYFAAQHHEADHQSSTTGPVDGRCLT